MKFPTASPDRGAIFARSNRLRGGGLHIGTKHGKPVGCTDLVALRAHPFQRIAVGMLFLSVRKTDRINDQMVVDALVTEAVESFEVRGDQHFITRKKTLGKFPTDCVRFRRGNTLARQKRLRVMGKPDAGRFAEPMLGQKKFRAGGLRAAMNSRKVLFSVLVGRFALL